MNIVLSNESEVQVVPASGIKCAWVTRASERRVKLVVNYSDEFRVQTFTTSPMVQAKAQDLLERITTALVSIHHAPLQKGTVWDEVCDAHENLHTWVEKPSVLLSGAPLSGSTTPTPVDAAGELPSVEQVIKQVVPDAATAWLEGVESKAEVVVPTEGAVTVGDYDWRLNWKKP